MEFVGHTANGKKVTVDRKLSHAGLHLKENPALFAIVQEALQYVAPETDEYACTVDLERELGYSDLVEVGETDTIVYAKRKGRETFTKFVKKREPHETRHVTLILQRSKDENYELWSAWLGELSPSFPGDAREAPHSREFWNSHALVYRPENIIKGTETDICPW